MLRTVSGQTVVLPVSGDLDLNMMIKLNDTGRFLWEQLQKETTVDEVVKAVLKTYDIEETAAKNYVEAFVKELEKNGFLC
jgi:hypothetical protein